MIMIIRSLLVRMNPLAVYFYFGVFATLLPRDSFFESRTNFSGRMQILKTKPEEIIVPVLAHKRAQFVSLTDIFMVLPSKLLQ